MKKNVDLLLIAHEITKKIILEDIAFRFVVKETFKRYKQLELSDKEIIAPLVGTALRHHILLNYLIKKEFSALSNEDAHYYLYLFISDLLFTKRVDTELFIAKLKDFISLDEINLIKEKYSSLDILKDLKKEVDKQTYLSIRYNTPTWLIKMWSKAFGNDVTKLTLSRNTKPTEISLLVNTRIISEADALASSTSLSKTDYENLLVFNDKDYANLELVKEGLAFPFSQAEKAYLEGIEIKENDRIAIYQEDKGNNLYFGIEMKCDNTNIIDFMVSSFKDLRKMNAVSLKEEFNNTKICRINSNEIVTVLRDKVDLFFLLPDSSNFSEIRYSPDYLIHFKKDSLDSLINNQRERILESFNYVNKGGYVCYSIPTLSNKEGHYLIESILKGNDKISLVKEKQFFPFEKENRMYYYAILRKEADFNE